MKILELSSKLAQEGPKGLFNISNCLILFQRSILVPPQTERASLPFHSLTKFHPKAKQKTFLRFSFFFAWKICKQKHSDKGKMMKSTLLLSLLEDHCAKSSAWWMGVEKNIQLSSFICTEKDWGIDYKKEDIKNFRQIFPFFHSD